MRFVSTIIYIAFTIKRVRCVTSYNVPKSVEEKLPTPVIDADFYNNQGPKYEVVTLEKVGWRKILIDVHQITSGYVKYPSGTTSGFG